MRLRSLWMGNSDARVPPDFGNRLVLCYDTVIDDNFNAIEKAFYETFPLRASDSLHEGKTKIIEISDRSKYRLHGDGNLWIKYEELCGNRDQVDRTALKYVAENVLENQIDSELYGVTYMKLLEAEADGEADRSRDSVIRTKLSKHVRGGTSVLLMCSDCLFNLSSIGELVHYSLPKDNSGVANVLNVDISPVRGKSLDVLAGFHLGQEVEYANPKDEVAFNELLKGNLTEYHGHE
ncbi:MAG: hypothetical protein ABIG93_05440 [archaeon]|nr:hypothetical protein [Nanoarchaeota archaeon]